MGNFDQKVNKFIEIFWEQNGYNKVLQGLQNTLMIAIAGLIIGIIIGTIIATVRVLPKYKTLPKGAECDLQLLCCIIPRYAYGCSAPCLLLCSFTDYRFEDYRCSGGDDGLWFEQRRLHI